MTIVVSCYWNSLRVAGFISRESHTTVHADSLFRSIPRALNPRGKYPGNVICIPVPGWEWIDATTWYVRQDIAFLNALGGTCNIGARTCARIACDGNSAIFLCNDVSPFVF
jgi:hypothetical protein